MNESDTSPFPAVVQESGDQQIAVDDAVTAQIGRYVQAVTPIGDEHAIEQLQFRSFKPARQLVALRGRDPGAQVRPGPPDLRRPPSTHGLTLDHLDGKAGEEADYGPSDGDEDLACHEDDPDQDQQSVLTEGRLEVARGARVEEIEEHV
jgi:hypothetical protein